MFATVNLSLQLRQQLTDIEITETTANNTHYLDLCSGQNRFRSSSTVECMRRAMDTVMSTGPIIWTSFWQASLARD